jgi:ribonuclease P protein subunit POP4
MNKKDIIRHEIIGLNVEIVKAKNPSLIGIKGKIVDETKNMITIKQDSEMKNVLKDQAVFNIEIGNKIFQIDGKLLVGRPEDRLKK